MSFYKKFQLFWDEQIRIKAILMWAGSHLAEGSYLSVISEYFVQTYVIRSGRVKKTTNIDFKNVSLIIRNPRLAHVGALDLSYFKEIFSSPFVRIFEKINPNSIKLIRHGIDSREKDLLLSTARKVMHHFLLTGNKLPIDSVSQGLEKLRDQTVSLDVAVWIDGVLRGSSIVEQMPCLQGLINATCRVVFDGRFKPIEVEELAVARIEITLWSDLYVPLTQSEIESGVIYYEKLHMAAYGEKRAWYLPEVFNCKIFKSIHDLLHSLAVTKGLFPPNEALWYISEPIDMIDSENPSKGTYFLNSSMIRIPSIFVQNNFELLLRESGTVAGDWLVKVQEEDGFIPATLDPWSSRKFVDFSLPRLMCTARSLAEWGNTVQNEKYIIAAEKTLRYVTKTLLKFNTVESQKLLTYAYVGQTALSMDKAEISAQALHVVSEVKKLSYEPILYLQVASFLLRVGEDKIAKEILNDVRLALESSTNTGTPVSFAAYAELLDIDPNFELQRYNCTVSEWYKGAQHQDGSFPDTTRSRFAYVRGTGKIFEVMSLHPVQFQSELYKSYEWLSQMQYASSNMFFISPEKRDSFIGAFRHDMGNPVAWIDSAAHVILGAARLLTTFKTKM